MKFLFRILAKVMRRNIGATPKDVIVAQLNEPRALPMGRQEFDAWSDRIIAGALIPGASAKSQKFALAEMLMHLKPTDSHCADAHFIHCLRKGAVNQVAYAYMEELRAEKKAQLEKVQEAVKAPLPAAEVKVCEVLTPQEANTSTK